MPEQDLAALAQEVDRFWQTPVPPRWSDDRVEPPDRLVYLLDHQYTERGLSWTRLKELVDSEIELRHWLACDGSEAVSNATRVETEELCFTRDSADCVGEPGNTLAQFLESPVRRRFEWPLAEPRRRIVHQLIDRHELPVRHETRRTGRPYALVLDKTGALFERAAAERREWASELAWLQQTKGGFGRREM